MYVKLPIETNCFPTGFSASPLLKLELKQRLLEGPIGGGGGGGGVRKCGRVYKHIQHRISVVREHGVTKQYSEKNPRREPKRVAEDGGGAVNESEIGVKFEGGILNGSGGKVHTKCSTKWAGYGGPISAILRALDAIEDLDEALEPWEEELSNKARTIILKEQRGWERALEIFEWFKRKECYELNVIHYNIMFKILGKAKMWSRVENLWDDMMAAGVVPVNYTYGTLINAYSKGGRRGEALLWLERMKRQGLEPDEVTMAIVLQVFKKTGEFQKAEEFFKKWSYGESLRHEEDDTTTIDRVDSSMPCNVCSNPCTYNTLIDMYGRWGKLQEALKTFELMLRAGVVPTTVTFNTLIHVCGSHGQLNEVTLLMQKMMELHYLPDTTTYNILISLHDKHGDMNMAAHYFRKIKEVGLEPNLVNYRTLLYAFSKRLMVAKAEELVAEMVERGLEIDEFIQSSLTRMYIESGMLKKSWLWFRRFHIAGNMSSECYSANIDAYGEYGHVSEAEKVFICCQEEKKLTVLEYNVMIKAYGVGKNYYKACQLFDSMESEGVIPDKFSYGTLIHILSSAEMPHIATPYLRKMQDAGLVSDCVSYCDVISSFVKLGQLEMAERLYEEMIGHNVQPDIAVYGVLINAFADAGSIKQATGYVRAMESAGLSGNSIIYKTLIKLYAKVGYLKEAEGVYKMLQSLKEGPDIYCSNCMIDLYTERCLVEEANKIFEYMKEEGEVNEFSYAMMLCMYRKVGRFEEAISIAQEMRERGLLNNLLSYNNILGLYASDGRFKEAVVTFKDMMKASIQPDDYTFKSLGDVLVKSGLTNEAVSNLEMLWKRDPQSGLKTWMSTLSLVVFEEADYAEIF